MTELNVRGVTLVEHSVFPGVSTGSPDFKLSEPNGTFHLACTSSVNL